MLKNCHRASRTVEDACPYGFGIDKVGATATHRAVFARPR